MPVHGRESRSTFISVLPLLKATDARHSGCCGAIACTRSSAILAWVYSGCSTRGRAVLVEGGDAVFRRHEILARLVGGDLAREVESGILGQTGLPREGGSAGGGRLCRGRDEQRGHQRRRDRVGGQGATAPTGDDLKSAFTPPVWIRPVAPRHLLVIVRPLSDRPLILYTLTTDRLTRRSIPRVPYNTLRAFLSRYLRLPCRSIRVRSGAPYEKRTRSDQDAGEPGLSQAGTRGPTYRLHIAFLHC